MYPFQVDSWMFFGKCIHTPNPDTEIYMIPGMFLYPFLVNPSPTFPYPTPGQPLFQLFPHELVVTILGFQISVMIQCTFLYIWLLPALYWKIHAYHCCISSLFLFTIELFVFHNLSVPQVTYTLPSWWVFGYALLWIKPLWTYMYSLLCLPGTAWATC